MLFFLFFFKANALYQALLNGQLAQITREQSLDVRFKREFNVAVAARFVRLTVAHNFAPFDDAKLLEHILEQILVDIPLEVFDKDLTLGRGRGRGRC
jgi:hypothetical protein